MKKVMATKNCVRCLKRKATIQVGHVLLKNVPILAGWCGRCYAISSGFSGHYLKKMLQAPVSDF